MKIVAFAASSSSKSINKKLATYTANLTSKQYGASVEVLDLNDYELPLFSQDKEAELNQPAEAKAFYNKLGEADVIIVSFAEHNGTYTAAYKNLFDWTSRIDMKVFQNKAMLLLSTSPGPGGAKSVLAQANASAEFFAANVKGSLSVPSFFDNFDSETGQLTNTDLMNELTAMVKLLA